MKYYLFKISKEAVLEINTGFILLVYNICVYTKFVFCSEVRIRLLGVLHALA
jgi:hypothetical protein